MEFGRKYNIGKEAEDSKNASPTSLRITYKKIK